MTILMTCVIGLVVGIVAKLLMPGRQPGGFFGTMAAGIAGAWLARWAAERFGLYIPLPGEWAGFASSVVGAIVILLLWGLFARGRA